MLIVKALQVVQTQGEITTWDLINELNIPISTYNNSIRPILRQHPLLKQTKDKKWTYNYPEVQPEKELNPQMSIEDWIKNSN